MDSYTTDRSCKRFRIMDKYIDLDRVLDLHAPQIYPPRHPYDNSTAEHYHCATMPREEVESDEKQALVSRFE